MSATVMAPAPSLTTTTIVTVDIQLVRRFIITVRHLFLCCCRLMCPPAGGENGVEAIILVGTPCSTLILFCFTIRAIFTNPFYITALSIKFFSILCLTNLAMGTPKEGESASFDTYASTLGGSGIQVCTASSTVEQKAVYRERLARALLTTA